MADSEQCLGGVYRRAKDAVQVCAVTLSAPFRTGRSKRQRWRLKYRIWPSEKECKDRKPGICSPAYNEETFASSQHVQLVSPTKSPSDENNYKVIQLANGLVATVVSDNKPLQENKYGPGEREEKLAACCLTVAVGGDDDPEEIQGLSHFLEHIIFMGSQKYPKENEFDSFIKSHGGYNNAFTTTDYTMYFFECPEKHLLTALDIFANLLINPTLDRDVIMRERESIESEYQTLLLSDDERRSQLLGSLASAHNPARKFTCGNKFSLQDNVTDNKLLDALKEHKRKHYSGDRMKLAVKARVGIDILEGWIIQCFSGIPKIVPNQSKKITTYKPYDMKKFCQLYKVMPINDVVELEISWVLPPTKKLYKTKPLHYIAFIFNHEGSGTLFSYLKRKHWAIGLYANTPDSGRDCTDINTIFKITIMLTDAGYSKWEEVVTALFAYVKMIKTKGINRQLYDEMKTLADTEFKYQEDCGSMFTVIALSRRMISYPPEDFITGNSLFHEYNPKQIKQFLSSLIPSKANISLLSKKYGDQLDQEEFWFKTKYKSEPLPPKLIKKWKSVAPYSAFDLPNKNIFLTTDFSLNKFDADWKYPNKIYQSEKVEIWYKGDNTYLLPIGSVTILIYSPRILLSPDVSVMVSLLCEAMHHQLNDVLYQASVASLNYGTSFEGNCFQVYVSGYNQHLNNLLKRLVQGMVDFSQKLEEGLLVVLSNQYMREYYNSVLDGTRLANDIMSAACRSPSFLAGTEYRSLKSISMRTLKDYVSGLYKKIYVSVLIQGNIEEIEAEHMVHEFVDTLKPAEAMSIHDIADVSVKKLPLGETYVRLPSFNVNDKNCVTCVHFQYGPGSMIDLVALELFVMMLEEPLFDTLRTKEQLGYEVSAVMDVCQGILGITISVVSQIKRFSIDHIKERIDQFLNDFSENFPYLPDAKFLEYKESLMTLKREADTKLYQETERNLKEISRRTFLFDRAEKELEALKTVDKDKVADLGLKTISPKSTNFRKLIIQIVSSDASLETFSSRENGDRLKAEDTFPEEITYEFLSPEDNSGRRFIVDFEDWRNSLPTYPVQKLVG